MPDEAELYYFHQPTGTRPVPRRVEFIPVAALLEDEPACHQLWGLMSTAFHTRRKFLSIWPGVRFVALSRDDDGEADGFLLVNTPANWQIDYVVVRPDRRGLGIGTALVLEAMNQAYRHAAPYVMLTSRESLRPLYEGCGFSVVARQTAERAVELLS